MATRVMPASPHPIELTIVVANGLMRFLRPLWLASRPMRVYLQPLWLKLQPLLLNLQILFVHTIAFAIALSELLQRSLFIPISKEDSSFGSAPQPGNTPSANAPLSDLSHINPQESFDCQGDLVKNAEENQLSSSSDYPRRKSFFLNLEIKRNGRTIINIKS